MNDVSVLYRLIEVAKEKFMNNNADIAEISDPNRAMKLAERFGQVYDDSWADSFEILTENKIPKHTTIMLLLEMLQVTCLLVSQKM